MQRNARFALSDISSPWQKNKYFHGLYLYILYILYQKYTD